jgi:multimeric flavodoxin WrbA
MEVRILGVSGSPVKEGNTVVFLKEAVKAAEEMGDVETEMVTLHGEIGQNLILEADGLLLATPTYFTRLSGYMAKFLDRMRCLSEGNLYRGSLEGKAVGALGVLWLRDGGAETTLLSIVQAAMHVGMFPIHAIRNARGGSYGAIGVSSLGGTGAFDKSDKLQVLKDEYGLKGARNLAQNMVNFLRLQKAGKKALGITQEEYGRYKIKQLTPEEKLIRLRAALAMLIGSAIRAVKNKYGKEGLEVIAQAWLDDHLKAVPSLMKMAGTEEKSLESFCKIVDYTDDFYGIEGRWVEKSEDKSVKLEKVCPVAKFWESEVCECVFQASMEGMGRGITGNPDFTATVQRYHGEEGKVCLVSFDNKIENKKKRRR